MEIHDKREQNSIENEPHRPYRAGGTIYVHGEAPICPRCASVLIQSGITRAVGTAPHAGTCVKWDKDGLIALDMFKEAKITFDPVGNPDQVSD